jgi:hypothetical protein
VKPISAFALLLTATSLLSCAVASTNNADESARLLQLHEQAMEAHRKGDVAMLLEGDSGDDFVVASRGEISRPSLERRREFFGAYLRDVRFTEYVDVVAPIVHVSTDGATGWVIAQVRARGTRLAGAGAGTILEFESSWIELYQKRDGAWRRVGNVSNFKA